MKKFLLISILNYFVIFNIFAVTKTSISNGNWNNASTWSPSGVPVTTDNVIINTNVTLNVDIDIDPGGSITINNGASLIGSTFMIDFNGSTSGGGSLAHLTNYGTLTVGTIRVVKNCGYSKIDNFGIINVEDANGTTSVLGWRSSDTLYNHSGATLNVLNGLFRVSNQSWLTCNGGNSKATVINDGYMNVYDAQFHAGSIFMNYLIVNIEPAPAPGLWMGAWEFHNFGCILGGDIEFASKVNNSGHNLSYFHDGSKIYGNMSITSSTQTITGVDDDGIDSNNACIYSPVNISNSGTITGEFFLNDPDGNIPGTVGPNVVEGTNNCGGPACALPCDIALAVSPGTCTPSTNEYTLTGTLTFTNPPSSGNLTVSVSGSGTQTFNAPFTSPQNYSITGLTSDGISHAVTAAFSADPTCTVSQQFLAPSSCQVRDLELSKSVDKSLVCIGDTVTYTIVVSNTGNVNVTSISVKDTLPTGLSFVSSSSSQGTYSNSTKIWTVGTINPSSLATLTIKAIANSIGIKNNTAQISAMSGTDIDSTPDNNNQNEDDLEKVCVSVKIPICPGESYTATIPGSPTGVQWYKNGVAITGATTSSYTITAIGTYTYTYTNTGCPDGSCCPFVVIEDEHCCTLNSLNLTTTCDNNGTPTIPSDDKFDINVNPSVTNGSSCYNIMVYGTIGGVQDTIFTTCVPYGVIILAAQGLPISGTSGLTIIITDSLDAQCTLYSSVSVPATCSNQTTCEVVVMYTQDVCDDNGTPSITTDDWFTMDFTASAINGGTNNLFEVVLNANPDGTGGTVLNPGGTTYGNTVTIGTAGQFKADSLTRYNITVRDFNDNMCHHDFLTQVVGNCSSSGCTLSVVCNPTDQTSCTPTNGSATTTVTGAQGNLTYVWSSGETTSAITGKVAGTYTVTVTDDFVTGCTSTCEAIINLATIPPTVTCSKTDNTNCASPNGTATATATGVTYLWSNTETTAVISNLSGGTYTVTVTSTTTGCTATCIAIVTNNTTNPTVTCSKTDNTNCASPNGTATATAAGVTYLWSNGGTTAIITGLSANVYTVTVTSTTTGCTNTCQAVVGSTTTLPTAVCTPVANTNCIGPYNGMANVTTDATSATYLWSTGATISGISMLAAANYTVTVTNTANSCSNTCVAAVTNNTVNPTAGVTINSQNLSCTAPNGSLTATTNATNPSYLWSNAATTATINNLSANIYTVTVTHGVSGCTNSAQATITNPGSPTCSISANTQPSCANLTGGSATASGSGGQSPYSFAWSNGSTGATVSGLTGGTHTVTVTDAGNCTSTCQVTLTTPTNCCNINAVTIQSVVCNDNGTPALITDNKLVINALVTNTNTSLSSYNATVNGGTTITPSSNIPYGAVQFTLGPGTAGGGATFTVTLTDTGTTGCTQTFMVSDPGICTPATQNCPTPKCGSATIQTNGN